MGSFATSGSSSTMSYFSLKSDSFVGTNLVKDMGPERGLAEWGKRLRENIGGQFQGSKISGHFVLIHMLDWALQKTMIPRNTWVTRDDLASYLTRYIDGENQNLAPSELPVPDFYPISTSYA